MDVTAPHTLAIATPIVASTKLGDLQTTVPRAVVLYPVAQVALKSSEKSMLDTRNRDQLIDHTTSPEPPLTQTTFWHPLLNMLNCASTDAGELILDSANRTTILHK